MQPAIPWASHVFRGALVLIAVLAFQQAFRGSVELAIAIPVAIGYVIVAELVRRRG